MCTLAVAWMYSWHCGHSRNVVVQLSQARRWPQGRKMVSMGWLWHTWHCRRPASCLFSCCRRFSLSLSLSSVDKTSQWSEKQDSTGRTVQQVRSITVKQLGILVTMLCPLARPSFQLPPILHSPLLSAHILYCTKSMQYVYTHTWMLLQRSSYHENIYI